MKRPSKLHGGLRPIGWKYQGGWINFAIAAVAALGSWASSREAGKGQRGAAAQEAALRNRELRLAEREDARGEQLFQEYQQTYLPREREFVADTFSDETSPEAAAARATTDVRAVSENAKQIRLRDARRLGVNPTSGKYAAMDNSDRLRETALEVTARDSARRGARDDNFQRQYSALSLGRNLPSQAGALTGNAARAIGGLADAAGRRTDQANALADRAGDAFGRSLVNLGTAAYDTWGKSPSYSAGYAGSETVRLSDAGDITVRQPVLYEG